MKRFTPAQALQHPFLRDPTLAEDEDEDDLAPLPFGMGVCRRYHFVDDEGNTCVYVWDGRPSGGKRKSGRKKRPRRDASGELEENSDDECPEGMVSVVVAPGEGTTIGQAPCEFHREELGYLFK